MAKKTEEKAKTTTVLGTEAAAGFSMPSEGVEFVSASEDQGPLVRIKAKDLAEQGIIGEVFVGRFEKMLDNRLNPANPDFAFRGANNSLVIVSSCTSLKKSLEKVQQGDLVRIVYEGQGSLTKGPFKGKKFHKLEGQIARLMD